MRTSINRWLILGLVLALAATTCCRHENNSSRFEAKVVSQINRDCGTRTDCKIEIRKATDFDWDRMYVFEAMEKDEIEKVLGCAFPANVDVAIEKHYAFLKSGKLVYSENVEVNHEHPIQDEVVFDRPEKPNYVTYTPDAVFSARKETREDAISYFELSPVKH